MSSASGSSLAKNAQVRNLNILGDLKVNGFSPSETVFSFTGPWAGTQDVTVRIAKVGSVVTLNIPTTNFLGDNSTVASIRSTDLDPEFRPPSDQVMGVFIFVHNGTVGQGRVRINNTGEFLLSYDIAGLAFPATTAVLVPGFSFTYLAA